MVLASNNYLITGTSGTGKTALIQELRRRGCVVFEEAQRAILEQQIENDGPALPEGDPVRFVGALREHCLRSLSLAEL